LPYPGEHSCRIADPSKFREDSFRRITSGKLSIIIAKKPGEDTTTTQAFRYPISDWTESEARAHCEKQGGMFEPAEGHKREGVFRFSYHAEIEPFEVRDRHLGKRRFVKVFLIDNTMNRERWGVTSEATKKALASLTRLSLLGPPEIAHGAGSYKVGDYRSHESNGVAYALFEIIDDEAWEKIQSREWRHVSPKITAHEIWFLPGGRDLITDYTFDHLAFCNFPSYPRGEDGVVETCEGFSCQDCFGRNFAQAFEAALQGYKKACNDVASSLRIGTQDAEKNTTRDFKEGDSMETIKSLQFSGAVLPYHESAKAPEGEDWNFDESQYDVEQLRRACAWFDSSKSDVKESYKLPHHRPDGTVVWRGVASAMAALKGARVEGGVDIPAEDKRGVYNHLAKHYADFDKEPPEYAASCPKEGKHLNEEEKKRLADLEAENKDLKEKLMKFEAESPGKALQAEVKELSEAKKTLEKRVTDMEAEKHLELVNGIVDMKIERGLLEEKDRTAEIERLKILPDQSLAMMTEEINNTVLKLEASTIDTSPKAKYQAEQSRSREEQVRLKLYGYTRDKDGKIVGG